MPVASMEVQENNDLLITFNDTMIQETLEYSDLSVRVYGSEDTYSLTWTCKYTSNTTMLVNTDITSVLIGDKSETVIVEFIQLSKFTSANSLRSVNIDNQLSGYLNKQGEQQTAKALGQTAMILFLVSVGIAVISSFGGNSMELMWGLMNTLQILYFISYINVEFPSMLNTFFEFLQYANANNEYLSELTLLVISEDHFNQEELNDKFGEK